MFIYYKVFKLVQYWCTCLFLTSSWLGHSDVNSLQKEDAKNFILMTMHKSGTHLFIKLINLIEEKPLVNFETVSQFKRQTYITPCVLDSRRVLAFSRKCLDKNEFILCHFHFSPYFKKALPKDGIPFLLLIRDLRDICVSATFYIDKHWPETFTQDLGPHPSFDQKLMWVITQGFGKRRDHWANFAFQAREALSWIGHPNAHFFRFEDLCGVKGGGSDQAQRESIERLAKILAVELSVEEINYVADHLHGIANTSDLNKKVNLNHTFREGKIGSWKEYFTEEHIALFKKHLGEELIALGYEESLDW